MKRSSIILFMVILLPISLISQSETWRVKAVYKSGKELPVNVYFDDGTSVPVFAIFELGNDVFMDVKGVRNGEKIAIKLLASRDLLVPVKGVSETGEIFKVKAEAPDGKILDVKGVSRNGNTLNIAAIDEDGKQIPLKAISPDGTERDVKGIKFLSKNIEMEIGNTKVIAHVKAMPTLKLRGVDNRWDITADIPGKENMRLVAISAQEKEYPITAEMEGRFPYLLNVRARSSTTIHIKLKTNSKGLYLAGIDDLGRRYKVKAVFDNGVSLDVIGGKPTGNITPIYIEESDGELYPLKAISSKGHEFNVIGLKARKFNVEGYIGAIDHEVAYFAHVKALAPAEAGDENN